MALIPCVSFSVGSVELSPECLLIHCALAFLVAWTHADTRHSYLNVDRDYFVGKCTHQSMTIVIRELAWLHAQKFCIRSTNLKRNQTGFSAATFRLASHSLPPAKPATNVTQNTSRQDNDGTFRQDKTGQDKTGQR